jgi:hypothetical protein
MKLTSYAVALLIVVASNSVMASTDPFLGKWILNPQQSKYPVGTRPKRMVIEMESHGNGIRYRSETTYANGSSAHSEYTAAYDGKSALVTGNRGMLWPVFLKRPNPRTVIASYTRALQVVATSRRVVSRDGQHMTITTVSKDQQGKDVTIVGVYDKQRENISHGVVSITAVQATAPETKSVPNRVWR